MRSSRKGAVTGESFAQVNNPDPFAPPVWRSPVYRTPEFVIWLVQLVRLHLAGDLVRDLPPAARHDRRAAHSGLSQPGLAWSCGRDRSRLGGPGRAVAGLARCVRPAGDRTGTGRVAVRVLPAPLARGDDASPAWRRCIEGRVLVPVLARVTAGGPVDRVTVKLVSGQSPADFADRAEGIAHGLGVHLCRVRPVAPGPDRAGTRAPRRARRTDPGPPGPRNG